MRDSVQKAQRIVVKVGTSSLTYESGRLDLERMEQLVRQLSTLANQGKEVVLVSSGAVAAGAPLLGFDGRPSDLTNRLAAASVGQGVLLHMYEKMFREYGHTVGQVLLTREDTVSHRHYVTLRNTFMALLRHGVIPIVNENDVVATEEFKIGDNDTLSATIASTIEADVLIILSDIEGLYTANPSSNPKAQLIHEVPEITEDIYAMAGGAGTARGTGGMYTKIQAANIASNSGVHMIIASGARPQVLTDLLRGEVIGTHFTPAANKLQVKKRWMAFGSRLQGTIYVDQGCEKALRDKGASLLPKGVVAVEGSFAEGETVSIRQGEHEIARGIVNYNSEDLRRIMGQRTDALAAILAVAVAYDEVVHRDNLVLVHS